LAAVTVTAGVITNVEQYQRDDIDDQATAPDNLSLNFITATGATKNLLQTYGWDTAATAAIAGGDLLESQAAAGGLRAKKYTSFTSLLDSIAASGITGMHLFNSVAEAGTTGYLSGIVDRFDPGSPPSGWTAVGKAFITAADGSIIHTGLTGQTQNIVPGGGRSIDMTVYSETPIPTHATLTDLAAGTCADHHWKGFGIAATNATYILDTGTAARNSMSGVIGDAAATPKASIAPNTRLLRNEAGNVTVLNWNSSSWELTFSATNKWTAATHLVDVTGAVEFLADATLNMTVGANSLWTLPGLRILPNLVGVNQLYLGETGTTWETITTRSDKLDCVHPQYIVLETANDLYLRGTRISYGPSNVLGLDLSGWATGGGLTGPTIQRKRVRVVDADTGADINLEILGIPIS
jgi:hypothetical protein